MVGILLFTLLFGIVGFGVVLSFKQTVTSAANEAARRAATTNDDITTPSIDERLEAAEAAVQQFESWGRDCTDPNMDCTDITIHDCDGTSQTAALPDCITVHISYDYAASPIVPNLPFVGAFMPDVVESSATAQLTFRPS
jgi:hypothetical protein